MDERMIWMTNRQTDRKRKRECERELEKEKVGKDEMLIQEAIPTTRRSR